MKLIVLTGLVSVEKIRLMTDLATYYAEQTTASVLLVDNVARLPMNSTHTTNTIQRVEENLLSELRQLLQKAPYDIVLLAVSEKIHPDDLFSMLETLYSEITDLTIQTIALIDPRTCDCFPTLRDTLERYADTIIMLPYEFEDVVKDVIA